jgi:DNA polymerase V
MYYLVDCNQFFVSCEQVFNPKLKGRPVVVLSSNDGCIVARSKEAKALGIPMGAPAFQHKETFLRYDVVCLSSNFALYADMSQRVMQILSDFSPSLEVYSIDEAFLQSDTANAKIWALEIQAAILRCTGISVAIGIGKTKTLAKLACDFAKKDKDGIFVFQDETLLKKFATDDVWGIGRKLKERLLELGITSAWEVAHADHAFLRKHCSVALVRTALELKGTPCFQGEEGGEERQSSILRSRSFGRPVTLLKEINEALAMHTATAAAKLREQEAYAGLCGVFLVTTQFYHSFSSQTLALPTSYTPHLIAKAQELLTPLFKEGTKYRKVGVYFSELIPSNPVQGDFWQSPLQALDKQKKAMQVLDDIQRHYGNTALRFAAEGTERPWKTKHEKRSPRYTTSWEELLEI